MEIGFDIIGELKAELMNNINYLPPDHEREILERMLYYSNECIERAVEEEKMISSFLAEKADCEHVKRLYSELSQLYTALDFKKLLQFKNFTDLTKVEADPLTMQFDDKKSFASRVITVDIDHGGLLLSDYCTQVKYERFVTTEESCFFRDADGVFSLTSYVTLKKINDFETLEVENLARKTITYNGTNLEESKASHLTLEESAAGPILNNKALKKVLSNAKR